MINNTIFGVELPSSAISAAMKQRQKDILKFSEQAGIICHYTLDVHPVLEELGARMLIPSGAEPLDYNLVAKPIIIGNIGAQSIRSSLAICSAARALGRMSLWFDIGAYPNTCASRMIKYKIEQEKKHCAMSQISKLFQSLYWERAYAKKQRSLKQNLIDQARCNTFAPLYADFTKDTPYVATHVYAAHSAVQAGLEYIVNALPGNCPYGSHLSEGTIHTAQTPYSYLGYKMLRGMHNTLGVNSIPESELVYAGHYVDHLMLQHLERDCEKRMSRAKNRSSLRWLISLDDFTLKMEILLPVFKRLLELEKESHAILIININNNITLWNELKEQLPDLRMWAIEYEHDDFASVKNFAQELRTKRDITGIHVFSYEDEILNCYATNAFVRGCDVLLSRPNELSLLPIPKLLARRQNREEFWNAIHASETGEATFECYSVAQILQMIDVLDLDRDVLTLMNQCIQKNKDGGLYAGAYEAVRLATEQR